MGMPVPPPDTRTPGQPGHIADHKAISDALTWLESQVTTGQPGAELPDLVAVAVTSADAVAAPGQLVPVDATTRSPVITLAANIDDGSVAAVKMVAQTSPNTVTISGGGATFNTAGGSASITLTVINQSVVLRYNQTLNVWYVQSTDLPLSQLDLRYAPAGTGGMTNPMTTLGDTVYGGASGTPQRLAPDTSNTRKFLRTQSSGGVGAAPAWDTIQAGDIPTLNQNTTGTAASVTGVTGIANGGTGQTTQQAALDAVAGAVTGSKVLAGDGTHVTLRSLAAADLPAATTSAQGAVKLNGTDGTIAALGSQAAGTSTLAAAADHVHPAAAYWAPADNGLLVANFDPGVAASANPLTAGTVYVVKWNLHQSMTVSNLWPMVVTAGAGASTGSFMGLYNSSGTRLVTSADCATAFTTQGGTAVPITAQALTAGTFVWVAFLCNLATTQVSLLRGTGNGFSANVNLSVSQSRQAIAATGAGSLPASFTPSSLTSTSSSHFWAGGS